MTDVGGTASRQHTAHGRNAELVPPPPVGMSTKQSFLDMVALMASRWLGRKLELPKKSSLACRRSSAHLKLPFQRESLPPSVCLQSITCSDAAFSLYARKDTWSSGQITDRSNSNIICMLACSIRACVHSIFSWDTMFGSMHRCMQGLGPVSKIRCIWEWQSPWLLDIPSCTNCLQQ